MRALAKMALQLESAEELYQQMLKSDDARLRGSAISALGERPVTPEVVEFAKSQLAHDDLVVRVMAMRVLAIQCEVSPDMKALFNALYDGADPKVQSVFETSLFPTCIDYQGHGYKGRRR